MRVHAGLLTHGSILRPAFPASLPVALCPLRGHRPSFPVYSGGTVRDFHPFPSQPAAPRRSSLGTWLPEHERCSVVGVFYHKPPAHFTPVFTAHDHPAAAPPCVHLSPARPFQRNLPPCLFSETFRPAFTANDHRAATALHPPPMIIATRPAFAAHDHRAAARDYSTPCNPDKASRHSCGISSE